MTKPQSWFAVTAVLACLSWPSDGFAQLDSSCMVSALNRTAPVQEDGTWVLPNVPANVGQIRVRATCVKDEAVSFGASSLITVPASGVIKVEEILFQGPPPIPSSLSLNASQTTLTTIGQTAQLAVLATYPGGSTADVTPADEGTDYRSSNPAIASVDAEGLVTAHASGVALVSAVNEGALAVLRFQVMTSGDSDGDGLPDDWELANGLDPNDPVDALDDPDGDALSTFEEFQAGLQPFNPDSDGDGLDDGREVLDLRTNPLLGDTDGDGLWDGLEIQTGSDPLDPNSFNLAAALRSIEVAPASFALVFNTLLGEASRQLAVTGTLIDGRSLNLTPRRYGTTYTSSDLTIASFGAEDGRVFAGSAGTATITITVSGFSATSEVSVETSSPAPLAWLPLPGFANGVDASGDYVYIAAGEAGLQVVDAFDLSAPFLTGSLDTPGNANDIRVSGSLAYVADGPGGLLIVDLSAPASPSLLGSIPTPGEATDVAVAGGYAYVVDELGLRVIDVRDPTNPVLAGQVDTPGRARGVDVWGDLAVIAAEEAGVHVIDVSDPANPRLAGSTPTRPNGFSSAADVAVREGFAYVADGSFTLGGLRIIDLREADNPVIVGSSSDQFGLTGVALDRSFVFASDYFYVNAVPIFDLASGSPQFREVLNFYQPPALSRDDTGNGIDVQDGVVFLVGTRSSWADNGVQGDSAFYIGRALTVTPESGTPPTVLLTAPLTGSRLDARRPFTLRADAQDESRVASVRFQVDGQLACTDFAAPYACDILVPNGSELRVRAVAVDEGGNEASAEAVFAITANAAPVVQLLAPVAGQIATEGTTLPLAARASDDRAVVKVDFFVNGALQSSDSTAPYRHDYVIPLGASQVILTATAWDDAGASEPAGPVVVDVRPDEPPMAVLIAPLDGTQVVAGGLVQVLMGAADDLGVAGVSLFVDGQLAGARTEAPYLFELLVPLQVTELRITAVAEDTRGQESTAAEIVLPVASSDPGTTAVGSVANPDGSPVAGATLTCAGASGTSLGDGTFRIPDVPAALGQVRCRASFHDAGGLDFAGISRSVPPIPGGITDVGQIQLQRTRAFLYPAPQLTTEAEAVAIADLNGDAIPDLAAANSSYGAAVFLGTPNGGYEAGRSFETAGFPEDLLIGDFDGDSIPDLATANGGLNGVSVLLGNGDGTFQPHLDTPADSRPVALAAGDWNGDGRLDLAVANKTGDNLSILLGNGDGTLALAQSLPAGDEPIDLAALDVDQDGDLDLLSAQWWTRDVRIFLGDGGGTFLFESSVSLGSTNPDGLTTGDFNGDGLPDFAAVSEFGNNVKVYFRALGGTYAAGPVLSTGIDPLAVTAADLNGDGHLDLATANNWSNDISLFLGNGGGSFGSGIQIFTGASPNELSAGDLNRDGLADLVTANTSALSLVFGLGGSAFDTDQRHPAGANPQGVAVGDFNGDGAQDLAVASADSDEAAVLLGRGDGTFTPEQRFAVGSGPVDMAAADFNGDGKLDLATADGSGDTLSLLLGQGDGTFATVPSALSVGSRPLDILARDLNGDGHIDLATANGFSDDVSVLLGRGDGTFAPQMRYPVGSGPVALTVGDLHGGGPRDLVTANDGDGDATLLSGNAGGTFDPGVSLPLGSDPYPFPVSIAVADLDGDGNEDLAVTYLIDFATSRYVNGVLRGNGDGTFQPLVAVPTGPTPYGPMLIADTNGDGLADLVNANPGGGSANEISISLGNGDGTFAEAHRYAVGCGPYHLATGDFNGDGQIDLVTSNGCFGSNDVSILLHH